jgi:integrase
MKSPLSPAAVQLLKDTPNTGDYVFMSGRSKAGNPISGFSKAKASLEKHIEDHGLQMEQWGFHDLRRTVRTHMSRLNVASEIAERVLNHTPQGIEAVYDRHGYLDEKRKALEAWSDYLSLNLNDGAAANVVKLKART